MQKFIKHGWESVQIVKLGIMVNIFKKSFFFFFQKAGSEKLFYHLKIFLVFIYLFGPRINTF